MTYLSRIACAGSVILPLLALGGGHVWAAIGPFPDSIRVVLENTKPLETPRNGRLPLYVLPITGSLAGLDDATAEAALRQLDARGIGYTVEWNHGQHDVALAEGLRIARIQRRLGMQVSVNANSCLYSFFDGSEATLHIGDDGNRFAETSFGGKLGCPFAIEHRIQVIKDRVGAFLAGYREAGVAVDFIFADWEIDGPIEWNDAWSTCKRCRRCREAIPRIDDFHEFQTRLRTIRSRLQREAFGDNVTSVFPEALVGNYGVYPHNGYRYWYDYFEHFAEGVPYLEDQRARYRTWFPEFELTGYTFAMPVVYTWYPTFSWYDFEDLDYRWFYNMLLVASNAGRHTPATTPIIPFVHWTTTSPPADADPAVRQFSADSYQDLLWHLLLRGHDTFFLWCVTSELPDEVRLVHEVYAAALAHRGFLDRGTPVTFDVPTEPGPVISGLRLGDRVLVRRSDFGNGATREVRLAVAEGEIVIPAEAGNHVVAVQPLPRPSGLIEHGGGWRFPIGFYELPADDAELKRMADAGVNIVRCSSPSDLDRVAAAGMTGWVSLPVQGGATDALRDRVRELAAHPALAAWEGPDEIVWMFTAFSGLAKTAGFSRSDWEAQLPRAVTYAREQGSKILPAMREGIELVKEIDDRDRPFWVNEAADSDVGYVRGYMDQIDITGCDYYAIRSEGSDLPSIGRLVKRWSAIGRGKPVWMVLQGFSWHTASEHRARLYPTFHESRFMAYDAIVHGARGIFYWGSSMIDEPGFRTSLYALTAELAALNPFLVVAPQPGVNVNVIDDVFDPPGLGVRATLRLHDGHALLILVNEDDHRHLGVDVTGLEPINGRELHRLYGDESATIDRGELVTRMQGHEVKVFSTDPTAADPRDGRDY